MILEYKARGEIPFLINSFITIISKVITSKVIISRVITSKVKECKVMKYTLMRYYLNKERKLVMLDLFDFRVNQNIVIEISMQYWAKRETNKIALSLLSDMLHRCTVKNDEHTLDEWFRIIKECVNYANDSTESNK